MLATLTWFEKISAEKAFCPTGEGGGVDPTCSPGKEHSIGQDVGKPGRSVYDPVAGIAFPAAAGVKVPALAKDEIYLVRYSTVDETKAGEGVGTFAYAGKHLDDIINATQAYAKDTGKGFLIIGRTKEEDWTADVAEEAEGIEYNGVLGTADAPVDVVIDLERKETGPKFTAADVRSKRTDDPDKRDVLVGPHKVATVRRSSEPIRGPVGNISVGSATVHWLNWDRKGITEVFGRKEADRMIGNTYSSQSRSIPTKNLANALRRVKNEVEDRLKKAFCPAQSKAFCPTGEGGGIDPTCSPGSASTGEGIFARERDMKEFFRLNEKQLTQWAEQAAEKFGLRTGDLKKITVHLADGPSFQMMERGEIVEVLTSAEFNTATKEIEAWADAMTERELGGVLSHEIQHARFHSDWPGKDALIAGMMAELGGPPGTDRGKHVSDYAQLWWDEYDKKQTGNSLDRAINESLAETARKFSTGDKDDVPPRWRERYEKFARAYADAGKK